MQKFVTFEHTFTKKEIDDILLAHIERTLKDIDFKKARWVNPDFTYTFEAGSPSIFAVLLIDDVKIREK